VNLGGLINFVVAVVVLAVGLWIVYLVIGMVPLPAPLGTVLMLLIGLIAFVAILRWLGFLAGTPPGPP
jgi:hypothetical protein